MYTCHIWSVTWYKVKKSQVCSVWISCYRLGLVLGLNVEQLTMLIKHNKCHSFQPLFESASQEWSKHTSLEMTPDSDRWPGLHLLTCWKLSRDEAICLPASPNHHFHPAVRQLWPNILPIFGTQIPDWRTQVWSRTKQRRSVWDEEPGNQGVRWFLLNGKQSTFCFHSKAFELWWVGNHLIWFNSHQWVSIWSSIQWGYNRVNQLPICTKGVKYEPRWSKNAHTHTVCWQCHTCHHETKSEHSDKWKQNRTIWRQLFHL